MHMRGEPRTMQHDVHYDDVVAEVTTHLVARRDAALGAGIARDAICVDPGIGFGKHLSHNLALLAHLRAIVDAVEVPVMVGASRKSFLGTLAGGADVDARDDATLATTMWAIDHGATAVRVHDVAPSVHAVRLWSAMRALDAQDVA